MQLKKNTENQLSTVEYHLNIETRTFKIKFFFFTETKKNLV